jgi:NADP-dependent 3-hydroxy acid dehydrogenase YdfG
MNKTVLISGVTSGIGKATMLQLLKDGFNVVGFAPEPAKCKSLAKELNQLFETKRFLVLPGDVTKEENLKKVVKAVLKKFKQLDILINNAGYGIYADADKINIKAYQDMINVNVVGVARLTKVVLPHMKQRKAGLIVNLDSISGRTSGPRAEFYCATKFAIMGYSEGLQKEIEKYKIKVATVCPGMVKTHFLTKEEYQWRMKNLWKGKEPVRLEAEDVARGISFICQQPDSVNIRDIVIMPFG